MPEGLSPTPTPPPSTPTIITLTALNVQTGALKRLKTGQCNLRPPSFVHNNTHKHTHTHTASKSACRHFLFTNILTRAATVPVSPGGKARGRPSSAGLHQWRAAAPGAEGWWDPPGTGGHPQTGAAAHSPPGLARLPGLPAPLHAHPQFGHLQPS